MFSTSGYMGAKYVQEFGPRLFDMSSASGYVGETYVQEKLLNLSRLQYWPIYRLWSGFMGTVMVQCEQALE